MQDGDGIVMKKKSLMDVNDLDGLQVRFIKRG